MERNIKYLLVGGGLASVTAAEAIRERDSEGSIAIIGQEKLLPYDRPPFTKDFLADDGMKPEDALTKKEDFYAEKKVEAMTGRTAEKIDRTARTVYLDGGDSVRYEKLLLATGARPNPIEIPGAGLAGVHLLRTASDSETVRERMKSAKRLVVVGAGFIGMEVAAFARNRGLEVTVLGRSDRPWSQVRPSDAFARFLTDYYRKNGVDLRLGEEAAAFEGGDRVTAVRTTSGDRIEADLALVAIGVTLNTELARSAGLAVDDRDGVVVNEFLETSDPSIFAAGDIACFPDAPSGRRWHIEHYMNAMWQGETVGATMAGDPTSFDRVPYFFSDEFDLHMVLRGAPGEVRETRVFGRMEDAEFVEFYGDEKGRARMAVAFSRDYEKLEPIGERIEAPIREKSNLADLKESDLGL